MVAKQVVRWWGLRPRLRGFGARVRACCWGDLLMAEPAHDDGALGPRLSVEVLAVNAETAAKMVGISRRTWSRLARRIVGYTGLYLRSAVVSSPPECAAKARQSDPTGRP